MIKKLSILTTVACSTVSLQAAEPKIEVAGIQLAYKDLKDAFDGFPPLNMQGKTSIALLLNSPDHPIIGRLNDALQVESLTDDQGTKYKAKVGFFAQIAKSKKHAIIKVDSETQVPKEATMLTLQGSISYPTATEKKTLKKKGVTLAKDTAIEINEAFNCKLTRTEAVKWGDYKWAVTIEWKRDIPELAEIRFYDAAGKLIKSSSGGSSRSAWGKNVTVSRTFNLAVKPKALNMEVDIYQNLQTKKVPFFLDIALGGQQPSK